MRFWQIALSIRLCFARTLTASLAAAIVLGAPTQSRADVASKRILMLHSYGPRFKPWSAYAEMIRLEISHQSKTTIEFQDHSLQNFRKDDDKSDDLFVDYLQTLNADRPPDLVIAIGAPAAVFVQKHRKYLFPNTPMIFAAAERRRLDLDQLTEYDAVVASSNDLLGPFENILHLLPNTKAISVVIGASPSEAFWLKERQREVASLAKRVQIRWYNELSFEGILKDAAALPPNSVIFWVFMNIDAAGVAHEGSSALLQLSAAVNVPIFSHDGSYFGDGIVGGPMQSVAQLSKEAAAIALRILNGEKAGDIKPLFVPLASPIFDGRQMQRWRIAESSLPPGSTIAFRELSIWERYWWQILLTIAVILLQAGLIAVLLREHRQRQLAQMQSRQRMAELARVMRFSTAGELTASIAHEINQPLGAILTNAETLYEILKSPTPDIAEIKDIVKDILYDDRRAGEVIRRMRSLLKKAPSELKEFGLNDLVRETLEVLSAIAVGRQVELTSSIAPDVLPILGDRIQIQQSILNVVVNGIDAMRETPAENRIISIRTSRAEKFAELSVSDRGPGIPVDKLKEIFEPFFTTKTEGMGMGLSIARTIVDAHNGQISAKNRVDGGASFSIRLPLVRPSQS